jgi:hypothetical protein
MEAGTNMRSRLLALIFICASLASSQTAGVDLAWKVLPRRVVADNFGSRIAKLYYVVVAVVGNNSGYDLQISSVFFQLPAKSGIAAPIPVDPYRIVRGTLEREHQVGLRSTSINVIKGLGPVLAGGSAFYTGAAYTRVASLFTSPFEKGVELIFPDKTINQMLALDNQALRDNTIISNNTQQILLVFVSRDVILTDANKKQLTSRFKAEFQPLAVMRELGDLVLVGQSISYINRITVTSGQK